MQSDQEDSTNTKLSAHTLIHLGTPGAIFFSGKQFLPIV